MASCHTVLEMSGRQNQPLNLLTETAAVKCVISLGMLLYILLDSGGLLRKKKLHWSLLAVFGLISTFVEVGCL